MDTFQEIVQNHPLLPYIREAGYAVRESWMHPERRLLDYLMIYIQEGNLIVNVDDVDHTFKEGEFCLLQPNDLHTLEGKTKTITPFLHFDIFYKNNRELSFPTRSGQTDLTIYAHLMQPRLNNLAGVYVPLRFVPQRPSAFKEKMMKTIGLWLDGDLLNQLEANQIIAELMLDLLKEMASFQLPKYQKPQSLNWITSYFSFHLAEPLSLEDMARRAQLSPSRFSAVFKQYFGTPPHQYLLHLRITHAGELLHNSSFTTDEIASYCGFANIHHFSKAFKKITGESPGSFRKLKNSNTP
jgi:AraC-like DNA-binding protein